MSEVESNPDRSSSMERRSEPPLPRSQLFDERGIRIGPALGLAAGLHAAVFAAALILPRFFDRRPPLRKPVVAHLVALGKPRDKSLLPRKESAPLPAAPRPAPSSAKPALTKPAPHVPSRKEQMERALARASGLARAAHAAEPDPERAGSPEGSVLGTAEVAAEGEKYAGEVQDAILANYALPSVISERERLYLSATIVAYIGKDGSLLRHSLQKKSGNALFDRALESALLRTKFPPPPPHLARSVREEGVELNFKP